ncbi:hypothetical protein C8R42DRAFT_596536 [Lentinula raphanica]|nr:hypothetical protein C8R42DRAFT_596536 [Lentinula raphanica]
MLNRELEQQKKETNKVQARAERLAKSNASLQKRVLRIPERIKNAALKAINEFTHQTMKKRNIVTPEMSLCIMDLVEEGASPAKVDTIIRSVAKTLGITITDNISGRTARRVVQQAAVASKIQANDLIRVTSGAILSGDGTSHKGLNYESRHVHFVDPETNERQTLFLGLCLAPNHTSEEQLEGWVELIDEMHEAYMGSPLGEKEPLDKREFYVKVVGMLTDHAADQKKLFSLFETLKKSMEREVRGERALKMVAPDEVLQITIDLSTQAVEAAGGIVAWDALSDNERTRRNVELTADVIRHFGQQDFEKLTPEQKAEVDFCIWCGCAMHKDLNAHKGEQKPRLQAATYWDEKGKTPPIYLPNKDNEAASRLGNDTERARVQKISACGGIKLCELMGLLLKHKDSKRGQQEWHSLYFEAREHIGFFAHFPDTSNTRYQSYCDAAAEIVVHLPVYWELLECVRVFETIT